MNKYKQFSTNTINPKPGEILKTYGVEYLNNPEVKSNKPLYHPFLVLMKLNGKYISLKLSSKCGHFSTNCRISADNYPANEVIIKDSFIDTKCIYELDKYSFIQKGITLSSRDFQRVYNTTMKAYCTCQTNISPIIAKIIFDRYIKYKNVQVGSLLKLPDIAENYLVMEITEDSYRCIPLYKTMNEDIDDILRINGFNSYINYSQEVTIPKEALFYILTFDIGHGFLDEINIKKANNYTLNPSK